MNPLLAIVILFFAGAVIARLIHVWRLAQFEDLGFLNNTALYSQMVAGFIDSKIYISAAAPKDKIFLANPTAVSIQYIAKHDYLDALRYAMPRKFEVSGSIDVVVDEMEGGEMFGRVSMAGIFIQNRELRDIESRLDWLLWRWGVGPIPWETIIYTPWQTSIIQDEATSKFDLGGPFL